eukprot:COSAG02_NODE_4499_length_5290_cov_40.601233_5_plen_132_part_00
MLAGTGATPAWARPHLVSLPRHTRAVVLRTIPLYSLLASLTLTSPWACGSSATATAVQDLHPRALCPADVTAGCTCASSSAHPPAVLFRSLADRRHFGRQRARLVSEVALHPERRQDAQEAQGANNATPNA